MKPSIAILTLAILGLGLVGASFVLNAYNTGSCPETSSIPQSFLWFGGFCDHTMTLSGITFWIRGTAEGIFGVGFALQLASVALGVFRMPRRFTPTTS